METTRRAESLFFQYLFIEYLSYIRQYMASEQAIQQWIGQTNFWFYILVEKKSIKNKKQIKIISNSESAKKEMKQYNMINSILQVTLDELSRKNWALISRRPTGTGQILGEDNSSQWT